MLKDHIMIHACHLGMWTYPKVGDFILIVKRANVQTLVVAIPDEKIVLEEANQITNIRRCLWLFDWSDQLLKSQRI